MMSADMGSVPFVFHREKGDQTDESGEMPL